MNWLFISKYVLLIYSYNNINNIYSLPNTAFARLSWLTFILWENLDIYYQKDPSQWDVTHLTLPENYHFSFVCNDRLHLDFEIINGLFGIYLKLIFWRRKVTIIKGWFKSTLKDKFFTGNNLVRVQIRENNILKGASLMSGTFVQSGGGRTPTSLPNLAEGLNPESPLGKSYPSLLSHTRTDRHLTSN